MRVSQSTLGVLACVFLASIVGCGGSPVSPVNATVLAGSWSLFGVIPGAPLDAGPNATNGIALTIKVAGQQLSATSVTQYTCGNLSEVDLFAIPMTGVVSDNGTFTLTVPASSDPPKYPTLEISGTAPSAPGGVWQGTYTYVLDPQVCPQPFKGSFTATQIQPLTGTYSGTAAIPGVPTPVSITANLTQGATVAASGSAPSFDAPVAITGGITVSGVSCLTSGTLSATQSAPPSSLVGNFVELSFVMNDGSNLIAFGYEDDLNAKTLVIEGFTDISGNCQFQISRTFTLSKQED